MIHPTYQVLSFLRTYPIKNVREPIAFAQSFIAQLKFLDRLYRTPNLKTVPAIDIARWSHFVRTHIDVNGLTYEREPKLFKYVDLPVKMHTDQNGYKALKLTVTASYEEVKADLLANKGKVLKLIGLIKSENVYNQMYQNRNSFIDQYAKIKDKNPEWTDQQIIKELEELYLDLKKQKITRFVEEQGRVLKKDELERMAKFMEEFRRKPQLVKPLFKHFESDEIKDFYQKNIPLFVENFCTKKATNPTLDDDKLVMKLEYDFFEIIFKRSGQAMKQDKTLMFDQRLFYSMDEAYNMLLVGDEDGSGLVERGRVFKFMNQPERWFDSKEMACIYAYKVERNPPPDDNYAVSKGAIPIVFERVAVASEMIVSPDMIVVMFSTFNRKNLDDLFYNYQDVYRQVKMAITEFAAMFFKFGHYQTILDHRKSGGEVMPLMATKPATRVTINSSNPDLKALGLELKKFEV
jgi:hypothetical protein